MPNYKYTFVITYTDGSTELICSQLDLEECKKQICNYQAYLKGDNKYSYFTVTVSKKEEFTVVAFKDIRKLKVRPYRENDENFKIN